MKNLNTRKLVFIAIMAAISMIFYSIEFPVIPAAPFLKVDLSDIPAVITGVVFGPVSGFVVAVIKNVLHGFITKEPMYAGEIANLFYCTSIMLPIALLYHKGGIKRILGFVFGILSGIIVMYFVNRYITIPLMYGSTTAEMLESLITIFTPFNLIKGIVISVATAFLLEIKVFKSYFQKFSKS